MLSHWAHTRNTLMPLLFALPIPDTQGPNTPDPAESFDLKQCLPAANGRQFVCPRGKNHVAGACFKYSMKLEPREGSQAVPEKDPWIANR